MFTGIVEELGEVAELERLAGSARLTIRCPAIAEGAALGSSVAVSGVCLTVTQTAGDRFTADVMGETLDRSSLGGLCPGDRVNLERPLRADGRLDGHIVQGHVDGTGVLLERRPAEHWQVLRISLPSSVAHYVVEKGSIGVDGVSLTVSGVGPDWFEVSLIPETVRRTTLGRSEPGAALNLEVDVIAKYVERLLRRGERA